MYRSQYLVSLSSNCNRQRLFHIVRFASGSLKPKSKPKHDHLLTSSTNSTFDDLITFNTTYGPTSMTTPIDEATAPKGKKKACRRCRHRKQRCDFKQPCHNCQAAAVGKSLRDPNLMELTDLLPGKNVCLLFKIRSKTILLAMFPL
jgi:hypothetical protein